MLAIVNLALFFCVSSVNAWTIEAVDTPRNFSYSSSRSIAVDKNGYVHIAYGGEHLYHAYYDGKVWQYETVDSSSGVGSYASIAIDSSDKIHICYTMEQVTA